MRGEAGVAMSAGTAGGRDRTAPQRACGPCSLCCTLLRVDELAKLGGTPCVHQQEGIGCSIHPRRPAICRAYRCLWLGGALDEGDRPDRLGAVLDLASRAGLPELVVHEAEPGAFERSPRLREIAERYRVAMAVRILDSHAVLDPERGFRVLLPGGEEQRVRGERVETWRDGVRAEARRLPWLERLARRAALGWRSLRLRRHRRGPRSAPASRRAE
jgi:Fe-S-cluster containining protein